MSIAPERPASCFELCHDATAVVRRLSRDQLEISETSEGICLTHATTGARGLIARRKGHRHRERPDDPRFAQVETLSPREKEVLVLLGDGYEMNEIGERLGVSLKTIETYRARLKHKLGIKKRLQLLAFAIVWRMHSAEPN
jgi:DNA-binding NarL/FixJ family response regulator